MITETQTAINTETAVKNPLGLKKIHHVEFYVGNAKQAEFFYRKAFGFSRAGYMGLETGNREVTSYLLRQSNINFILSTPMSPEHPGSEHIKQHGDGVHDIAFLVEDADHAFHEAVRRGATPVEEPHDHGDENGVVRHASIATYGDTIHSFLSYDRVGSSHVSKGSANGNLTNRHTHDVQPPATAGGSDSGSHTYNGVFLPGFVEQRVEGDPTGIMMVDHIVGNVEIGKMAYWCDFYRDVMGFFRYITFDDNDISTEYSALMSIVMSDGGHNIKFPINEPAESKKGKSQIQEYIEFYRGAGAQHIALLCRDIRSTVAKLKENGIEFLTVPDTYYDELPSRVGDIDEDIASLKELGILVDRDEEGYLLQIFTKPVEDRPTVFYEILQRKGCKGFGKGNFKALFVSIEEEQRRRGKLVVVNFNWETVHTIDGYYDGPRSGATELKGQAYWYRSLYLDGEWNSTENRFDLTPLSSELFTLELERNAIFARWDQARKNGIITWLDGDLNSFGALPDEMLRYRELNNRLDSFLDNAMPTYLARAYFSPDAKQVHWEIIENEQQANS